VTYRVGPAEGGGPPKAGMWIGQLEKKKKKKCSYTDQLGITPHPEGGTNELSVHEPRRCQKQGNPSLKKAMDSFAEKRSGCTVLPPTSECNL